MNSAREEMLKKWYALNKAEISSEQSNMYDDKTSKQVWYWVRTLHFQGMSISDIPQKINDKLQINITQETVSDILG